MEDAASAVRPGGHLLRRITLGLAVAAGIVLAAAGPARASAARQARLDPFAGSVRRVEAASTLSRLSPFRSSGSRSGASGLSEPAAVGGSAVAAATTPAGGAPSTPSVATRCQRDDQCGDGSICDAGQCRLIERRTNILYLYYREGSFTEIFGLYWSKRGASGYTVLFPLYWRTWTPTSRSRVVAPFFWRFEDDVAQRTSTVIVPVLPISWSRQPDARSFGVWPLFYASTKFGWAAPLLGTFAVGNPDRGTSFGAAAFVYWWSRKPDQPSGGASGRPSEPPSRRAWDLLLPLFFSTRSQTSAFTFALPLTFYWRRDVDRHTLAIPFFYRHAWKDGASLYTPGGYHRREGARSSGSLLWVYWFGRNRATGRASDVLFPLIWSFRGASSGSTVVFPLLWDFWSPEARTTVGFPVVHIRRGGTHVDTVAGLFWGAASEQGRWRFQLVLPALFAYEGDGGRRRLWLTPLGGYSRNDAAGSRTLALFPGIVIRRDPVRALDVVALLYVRHKSHEDDATTRLLGVLLYLRDDPQGSTKVLFPLFWRFKDAATGAGATALLPLFFHRSGPRDRTTAVGFFPIWFYSRSFADGGWSAGLTPLAYFGRRGESRHALVLPVFWHLRDARSSQTGLLPLFYASRDASGYRAGILPLLTFFGRSNGESYQVQFPLFWRFASARTGSSTAATPLGFFTRSPEGWRLGVGPLLPLIWAGGGGPQRHLVLFPLFWHFGDDRQDRSTTVFLNYLHRRSGGETTDALFPLFHYRRGARSGDPSASETSFTLFPLVHYRRDRWTRALLTPLGGLAQGPRRSAGFLAFVYYWYAGQTFQARGVPLLFADLRRRDTGQHTLQIGPYVAIDDPARGSRARVLFPLFGRYDDGKESDTWVFPSYFRQRKPGYAVDTFLPLFWFSNWEDRSTSVVGPWYRREGKGVSNHGIFPLYHWAKNPSRTLLAAPLLLTYHRRDFHAKTSLTIVGPFVHRESTNFEATVLFPFWWSGRDGARSHRVLGPIFWSFEDRAANRSWGLLPPFYWSRRGPASTKSILPLAWLTRDRSTGFGSEALLPLFYASHGPDRFTLLTLLAGFSRTPTARRWYAGPLYVSDSVESRSRFFLPLYFDHLSRATETRTRVFVPLLHVMRSTPEKSLSTFAGLFWRRRDVSSATTVVLPLFYDVHDFRDRRTTVLLPLMIRHRNYITDESTLLAPLLYRRTAPKEATTVLFPLFWDLKRADRRTTVLVPLFAHWRRPTHAGTYVFPNFYYRRGLTAGAPNGTWRLFVPPIFDAAVDRPGDFRWEILGGLFGKERIGRNHYLKLFFFSIQTQKPSAAQTAWYGGGGEHAEEPRQAADARRAGRTPAGRVPPKGLSTHVW